MTGDLDRADKELNAALERAPDFASAHATRGTLALMRRDVETARSELALADKLAPDLSLVQWGRAELALRDGDGQQALVLAERAVSARPSFDARLRMGMLLRQLGKRDALRQAADELLQMVPDDRKAEVRSLLASVLGPAALGDAEPADAGDIPAAAGGPDSGPDGALERGDGPDPVPEPERKGAKLRLGDPSQRLQLKLDP